jgi:hypothetical protein
MQNYFLKNLDRLFFKKWTIGICKGNIEEIIRTKSFDPDIQWLRPESNSTFYADPFLVHGNNGTYKVLLEEYPYKENYGKISLMTFDKDFKLVGQKVLLDTNSHLSYPFAFSEDGKTYIFPESAQSNKLSCYEYDPVNETISFVKNIIDLPLRDSTIIKHGGKYWIFGTMSDNGLDYKLNVYYSDKLLGPYQPHRENPIKNGLDGTRSAGNFITVDGEIYRPTQNCMNSYGESITINKILELTETSIIEAPYMTIDLNPKNKNNKQINTIHTINVLNNTLVVDGKLSTFAPLLQVKNSIKYRLYKRKSPSNS